MIKLTVTICGCGNGAHACAALMSMKGHKVNIYSPLKEEIVRFKKGYEAGGGLSMKFGAGLLSGAGEKGCERQETESHTHLLLNQISSDAAEVIPQASVIFVITPSFAHKNILECIKPYLMAHSILVFLPSRGGLELETRALVPNSSILAFQTLPWATRISRFGSEVLISGKKKSILAASLPADLSDIFFRQMEELLDMEVIRIKHIFTMTLSNVGQIIHPGIMYSIFKKNPHALYSKDDLPLFYQGIDEEGGERLEKMSEEIGQIAEAASYMNPDIEKDKVLSIKDWLLASYKGQIKDTSSVYKMFVTNEAYAGLKAPVKMKEEGVYTPDFSTRYITEDIPYGLLITKSIGMMLGKETPTIDEVISGIDDWGGYDYMGSLKTAKLLSMTSRLPENYGISDVHELF